MAPFNWQVLVRTACTGIFSRGATFFRRGHHVQAIIVLEDDATFPNRVRLWPARPLIAFGFWFRQPRLWKRKHDTEKPPWTHICAYAIMRSRGVELGKADYVAHMFAYLRPGTMPQQ